MKTAVLEPAPKPVRKAAPATKKAAKIYPQHECFGNPTNVCRVCGEKYAYTAKPFAHAPK